MRVGFMKKIAMLYIDGFKHLKLGKTLWKIIIIKILIIFVILKIFIYDNSLSTLGNADSKSAFVINNLTATKH